jgi:serine/threonine protein kinase
MSSSKASFMSSSRQTTCGTPLYMSPEGVRNHQAPNRNYAANPTAAGGEGEGPGMPVDWWMLGVLSYEMMYGKTPFTGQDMEHLMEDIMGSQLEFPAEQVSE